MFGRATLHSDAVSKMERNARRKSAPFKSKAAIEITGGLALYFDAFFELDTERFDIHAPIPWHCVQEFAMYRGFDADQVELLHIYTRAIDTAVTQMRVNRAKAEARRNRD